MLILSVALVLITLVCRIEISHADGPTKPSKTQGVLMPKKQLPAHPNVKELKQQPQALLEAYRVQDSDAFARMKASHPEYANASESEIAKAEISLPDAQWVVAREYGFDSWKKMTRHVEGLEAFQKEIDDLRAAYAEGDPAAYQRVSKWAHLAKRVEGFEPYADTLTVEAAKLIIANEHGFARGPKYESYLYLDLSVRDVIQAASTGDLETLQAVLHEDASAVNPKWVPGFEPSTLDLKHWSNDSIPLFTVSEAVFNGTISVGTNEYAITKTLIDAGADPDIDFGHPLMAAVSFNAIHVVEALLDGGAAIDGVDGDGLPMAYPQLFGYTEIVELLASRGAKLDLRFAAGLGDLDRVQSFFNLDDSLKPAAGTLADPYTHSRKTHGESVIIAERTRQVILDQAFMFACLHGRLEVARFLLEKGADVNALVPGFDVTATPLHRVAWFSSDGATADKADIEQRRLPTVKFLLENGADITIRDKHHNATPLDWASGDKIKELLEEHRSNLEGNIDDY